MYVKCMLYLGIHYGLDSADDSMAMPLLFTFDLISEPLFLNH